MKQNPLNTMPNNEMEWEKSEHERLQSLENTRFLKILFPVW